FLNSVSANTFSQAPVVYTREQLLDGDPCRTSEEEKGEAEPELSAVSGNDSTNPAFHLLSRETSNDVPGTLELLAVSIRPYYLPREFPHVIAITTYIPPSANADAACELLHSVVAQLQTEHPQAFLLITGDFNHASLSATLPNFHQYVNCCTGTIKLWTCCLQTQQAYSSSPLPSPAGPAQITTWSEEARDALRDCFDTTDWEVLCGPHEQDIDSLTDCITDYINFCVETTVPTKRVQCFSNNKPWVTPDLRALLLEKRTAFQSGDRDELRRVQRDLETEDQRVQGQLQEENGGPPAAKQREGGLERTPSYLRTG
ncbi:hypothetical protein L3Q82_015420, partial [Scortum barcoo]